MDKNIPLRLKDERARLNLSQKEVADATNVASKTVGRWEKDDAIPSDKLALLDVFGFDIFFILTGRKLNQNTSDEDKNVHIVTETEFSYIPVRDVIVSAGDGAFNEQENVLYNFAYRKDWLKSRGLFEKDLEILVVRGDSMEPTISDGDSILINKAENDPCDGHIYVIRSGENVWVKRVQTLIDGSLSLISDNKIYAPMVLNLETAVDVQIIGKVVNSSKNFY